MSYQFKASRQIRGVNESISPESLPDDVLAIMNEMVLDVQEGVPTARNVFGTYGSSQSGTIRDLDEVSINGTDYLVAGIDDGSHVAFMKSANGTGAWANVKTGLTTGKQLRLASYNQQIIATNGVDAPFITDLTTTNGLALPIPDASGVYAYNFTTGGFLTHQSKYMYCFVFQAFDGALSVPSRSFYPYDRTSGVTYYISTNGTADTCHISLLGLPTTTDSRIQNLWIFRTIANQSTFYFAVSLPIGTSSYVDTLADTSLDSSTTLTAVTTPATAMYVLQQNDRIFFANISNVQNPFPMYPYIWDIDAATPDDFNTFGYSGSTTGLTPGETYQYGVSETLVDGTETAIRLGTAELISGSGSPNLSVQLRLFFPLAATTAGGTIGQIIDQTITSVNLYRTKGNGSTLYLVKKFTPADWFTYFPFTNFVDNVSDSSLTQAYVPLSNLSLSSSIVWSEVEQIQQFNTLNIQNVSPDDGNPITGILDDNDGILIFKQSSIYKLYTNQTDPAGLFCVVPNIGCDQPNSLVQIAGEAYFVSKNQIYLYSKDGINPIPVSQNKRLTANSVTSWNSVTFSQTFQWIIWNVTIGSDNWLLILDIKGEIEARFLQWYQFKVTPATFVLERKIGSDKGKLLIAGTDTDAAVKLGYYKAGTSDNWKLIPSTPQQHIRTRTFSDGGVALMRLRKIALNEDVNNCNLALTVANPDTGLSSALTHTNASNTNEQIIDTPIDSFTGNITSAPSAKFYFDNFGTGLVAFRELQISYNPINRGTRG